eukprot:TRINITY_DN6421_c0_g1_i1.p1 TRINITY_DN6421_c0_g1~~TRINITY_DN6421_c0_g1_i1.p1  ORF type:complete len:196 (-),score=28.00 TRINITY_DN6421_c0_g1_i1:88-675(-)
MSGFGTKEFWDEWYINNEDVAEWYISYHYLGNHLRSIVKKEDQALVVGCGNSRFSEEMSKDGFELTNIDYSPKVIDYMSHKYPTSKYIQADVSKMGDVFADRSFDTIIDKGTLDSILCTPDSHLTIASMLMEIKRIIRPGGRYLVICDTHLDDRQHYFRSLTDAGVRSECISIENKEIRSFASEDRYYLFVFRFP